MEAWVRLREDVAASTKSILGAIRADQRALRAEMVAGFAALRAAKSTGSNALRSDIAAVEQRLERDFRITFAAIITTTLGLAYLVARTAQWL